MGMFKSGNSAGSSDVPVSQVVSLKQQGFSNSQIIQFLQRDGFTSSQIFDALSQSEMQNTVPSSVSPDGQSNDTARLGAQLPPLNPQPFNSQPNAITGVQGNTEELIEAIIEEKWNELVKDISKVVDWKQKADQRLNNIELQITEMKSQFDKLNNAVLGRIQDYDKNILDVGVQLQAMEKVFGKVLPTFVDNVNELNRITDKMRTSNNSPSNNFQSNNSQRQSISNNLTNKKTESKSGSESKFDIKSESRVQDEE